MIIKFFYQYKTLIEIVFLIIIALILHYIISWAGINLTDEGFILSYSRRILDGQIPHKDFISIRPVLSPIIHLPTLLLNKDYIIWISRLVVWVEVIFISWFFIKTLFSYFNLNLDFKTTIALTAISFMVSFQKFHLMAWHTLDGLFLIFLGIYLIKQSKNNTLKSLAYFIISLSSLCKQNFLVVPIAVLILNSDWRKFHLWLVILLPIIFYSLYFFNIGVIDDLMNQLLTQTDLISTGFLVYFNIYTVFGILLGVILTSVIKVKAVKLPTSDKNHKSILPILILIICVYIIILYSKDFSNDIKGTLFNLTFYIFGILLGITFNIFIKKENPALVKFNLIIIIIAWSASISVGYNSPSLMLGILLLQILFALYKISDYNFGLNKRLIISILSLTIIVFLYVRMNYIYYEQPARNLNYPINNLINGTANIKTNSKTFAFLKEISDKIFEYKKEKKTYIILPSSAIFWLASEETNPLPIDWVQSTELKNSKLYERVKNQILSQSKGTKIILMKYYPEFIYKSKIYIKNDDKFYPIVGFVRNNFKKIEDKEFLEIFEL